MVCNTADWFHITVIIDVTYIIKTFMLFFPFAYVHIGEIRIYQKKGPTLQCFFAESPKTLQNQNYTS